MTSPAKRILAVLAWSLLAGAFVAADRIYPNLFVLPSGLSTLQLLAIISGILAALSLAMLLTAWSLSRRHKPLVEAEMLGRIYALGAYIAVGAALAYAFAKISAFGTFFSLFGGMILGWSLQAPISGFAAWMLVSLKRPFRPGDRVQFPGLGLTGDVVNLGAMYTVLNQVGGAIGSEEAVGRHILIPNAMLFSQVAINYTVTQEAAYMLDEVVVRITYDSDWRTAEGLLLDAARKVTGDVVQATGAEPYIRSDLYDYGVYMRLRYQTRVKDRAKTVYEINKQIFHSIQQNERVDLAIPYVYSYKTRSERRDQIVPGQATVRELVVGRIHGDVGNLDPADVELLAHSISVQGLLQPIVVAETSDGSYELVAGHLRLAACRLLGWQTISAIVQEPNLGHTGP